MVKTASSGKMKGDLHRMTHFFLLRQAPVQHTIAANSKVINPLLLAEETDRHRKQTDNMKASPKVQCYGHRHIQ